MQPAAAGASALAAALASAHRPPALSAAPHVSAWWGNDTDTLYVVPGSWWRETPRDVYNMLVAPYSLVEASDFSVPGYVQDVLLADEGWVAGLGTISSVQTNMWQPAPDRRGDLARRYMYMALIYPRELWNGRAVMFYTDGGWPLLTPYATGLLLDWHRADPVDERERAENSVLAECQGNINPFVEWPEVAEYLWGDRVGEEWHFPGDDPRRSSRCLLRPTIVGQPTGSCGCRHPMCREMLCGCLTGCRVRVRSISRKLPSGVMNCISRPPRPRGQ